MRSQRWTIALLVATILATLSLSLPMKQEADSLYVNGRIYTMDEELRVAEALAIRGDRIAAVGTQEDLVNEFVPARVVDLQGRTVLPGFIDAHVHLMGLALAKITVDLTGTTSEREAGERVLARVRQSSPGQWVRGRGWDQNDWPSRAFPTQELLNRVAPANPVYLVRVDGHAAWLNRLALEIAGIDRETPDPPGGKILRDARGNPTGILIDAAMEIAVAVLPRLSGEEAAEGLRRAVEECIEQGITTVHDMGIDQWELDLYKQEIREGRMPLRIFAAVAAESDLWQSMRSTGPLLGFGNHHLTVRSLKLYMDGALGSRGAALLEPYSDDPDNRGLTMVSTDELLRLVRGALVAGFQPCVHAIGDRANKLVLDVYEAALAEVRSADARPRIEHAQVLAPDDIPRFRQLGVIPSMQPTHCTSDMYWAEARLGPERIRGAYAWRSLLNTGVVIPGGSDFPVEQPSPLLGIAAAVTRRDPSGLPRSAEDVRRQFQLSESGMVNAEEFNGGWYVSERVNRSEAVRIFTAWAAWAGFEERLKGTLERGKLADFVVLSSDLFQVSEEELPFVEVEMTVIGGREVFSRAAH